MSAELAIDEIMKLRAQVNELSTKNNLLKKQITSLLDEIDRLDPNSAYCPYCGSCGVDGCCPPTMCKEVQCAFGKDNIRNYGLLLTESWAFKQLLEHIRDGLHCASLVGGDAPARACFKHNGEISQLLYKFGQIERQQLKDEKLKSAIKDIEDYVVPFSS